MCPTQHAELAQRAVSAVLSAPRASELHELRKADKDPELAEALLKVPTYVSMCARRFTITSAILGPCCAAVRVCAHHVSRIGFMFPPPLPVPQQRDITV